MLTNLSIRDVILIEKLDLEFTPGLTVLTGETGAGKSIVLDSLALALGARSEKGLVRSGAKAGSVSVRFEPPRGHQAFVLLEQQGIDHEGEIVLRRVIQPDGRSRSYVNDGTVSASLLKELGQTLVEIHGQMDQHGLMDAKTHTSLLDLIGGHETQLATVRSAYATLTEISKKLSEKRELSERARDDNDYLTYRLQELTKLGPEIGEEEQLAEERHRLQNQDKLLELLNSLDTSLNGDAGVAGLLGAAQRRLDRAHPSIKGQFSSIEAAIERAMIETVEASEVIAGIQAEVEQESSRLESVEDRLFALKDAARKYRVAADELPTLLGQTQVALDALQSGELEINELAEARGACWRDYRQCAKALSDRRQQSAKALTRAIMAEFPPLKLDRARFRVSFDERDDEQCDGDGAERMLFEISTNPGQPFGPLGKIASGGELSRLMLALKVVLSKTQTTHSMVFDEVDSGVGGATAAAVGDRLAKLAETQQVLVVTHAPQVAARANQHFTVTKIAGHARTDVRIDKLSEHERLDEIARMISGEQVTPEARAAAARLLNREPA